MNPLLISHCVPFSVTILVSSPTSTSLVVSTCTFLTLFTGGSSSRSSVSVGLSSDFVNTFE